MRRNAFDPSDFQPDEEEAHPELREPRELTEEQLIRAAFAFEEGRMWFFKGFMHASDGEEVSAERRESGIEEIEDVYSAVPYIPALASYLVRWRIMDLATNSFLSAALLLDAAFVAGERSHASRRWEAFGPQTGVRDSASVQLLITKEPGEAYGHRSPVLVLRIADEDLLDDAKWRLIGKDLPEYGQARREQDKAIKARQGHLVDHYGMILAEIDDRDHLGGIPNPGRLREDDDDGPPQLSTYGEAIDTYLATPVFLVYAKYAWKTFENDLQEFGASPHKNVCRLKMGETVIVDIDTPSLDSLGGAFDAFRWEEGK